MATEETTTTAYPTEGRRGNWKAGVVGGLAGGLLFGIMISMMMTEVMESAIPALWGLQGGIAGWFIHMVNSAIFGVVFAAIVGYGLKDRVTYGRSIGVGLVYGLVLWIVAAAMVMPIWLQAVGFAGAPAFPNFDVMSLVGHLVYGLVLGAVYPAVQHL